MSLCYLPVWRYFLLAHIPRFLLPSKDVSLLSLAYMLCWEASIPLLSLIFGCNMSFILWFLLRFLFIIIFSSPTVAYLDVAVFMHIPLGVCWSSWICNLKFWLHLGVFLPLFLQNAQLFLPSLILEIQALQCCPLTLPFHVFLLLFIKCHKLFFSHIWSSDNPLRDFFIPKTVFDLGISIWFFHACCPLLPLAL